MRLPEQRAVVYVDGVNNSIRIAEKSGLSLIANRDGGFHRSRGLECPPKTASCGIERIDSAVLAPHKQSALICGGLAICSSDAGESECPLQFQVCNLLSRESCGSRVLESPISRIASP